MRAGELWTSSGSPQPSSPSAVTVVPVTVLLFTALPAFLRFDGQRGDRASLEALHPDLLAGFVAVTVAAILDTLECFVDLADQFALAVAGAQFQAELRFLGGTIVRIGEVRGFVLHVQHGPIHFLHQ